LTISKQLWKKNIDSVTKIKTCLIVDCLLFKNVAIMILSIFITLFLMVVIIGLATARLNAKVPCDHDWVETEGGDIKCRKCYRVIRHVHDLADTEPGVNTANSQDGTVRPLRPEAINIAADILSEAGRAAV
jgi:hypothetical protein